MLIAACVLLAACQTSNNNATINGVRVTKPLKVGHKNNVFTIRFPRSDKTFTRTGWISGAQFAHILKAGAHSFPPGSKVYFIGNETLFSHKHSVGYGATDICYSDPTEAALDYTAETFQFKVPKTSSLSGHPAFRLGGSYAKSVLHTKRPSIIEYVQTNNCVVELLTIGYPTKQEKAFVESMVPVSAFTSSASAP